ncbi:DNA polymerase III, delta subunit [Micrococcales bacterium KH10]|nr:DNA polymerase III, delta subunit [Micrococcales bacterium KH10]
MAASKQQVVPWDQVELEPVLLVQGPESLLADRAVQRVRTLAEQRFPSVERSSVDASIYQAGELSVLTSPSLFAEPRLIVIDQVQSCSDAFISDAIAYLDALEQEVFVVLVHRGGVRGKKLLDALRSAGHTKVACDALKRDADKTAFVSAEFKRASRRATADAVQMLVQSVGSDLRELAAACSQLISDTTGMIDVTDVERYYGGRVEVTAFKVADLAIAGQSAQAAVALRHALATGSDPVPLVAAIAAKLRTMAKVASHRGSAPAAAKDLGLAPWQVERARKDLRHWSPTGLAQAVTLVAAADADVKGAARDPIFAVERAVLKIARIASSPPR